MIFFWFLKVDAIKGESKVTGFIDEFFAAGALPSMTQQGDIDVISYPQITVPRQIGIEDLIDAAFQRKVLTTITLTQSVKDRASALARKPGDTCVWTGINHFQCVDNQNGFCSIGFDYDKAVVTSYTETVDDPGVFVSKSRTFDMKLRKVS